MDTLASPPTGVIRSLSAETMRAETRLLRKSEESVLRCGQWRRSKIVAIGKDSAREAKSSRIVRNQPCQCLLCNELVE